MKSTGFLVAYLTLKYNFSYFNRKVRVFSSKSLFLKSTSIRTFNQTFANAMLPAKPSAKELLKWVNIEGRLRPVNREGYCLQFAGPGAFVVTGPCMNNYLGTLSFE